MSIFLVDSVIFVSSLSRDPSHLAYSAIVFALFVVGINISLCHCVHYYYLHKLMVTLFFKVWYIVSKCSLIDVPLLPFSGETQKSLAYQFRVSRNLVCSIIPEVCQAIYQVQTPTYLKMPSTIEEWQQIASDYFSQWQFPMCIRALDRKRILVQKLANTGSQF